MEAIPNIESQTIERFYKFYVESDGDEKYRFVVTGVWTVDLKTMNKMHTDQRDNEQLYRLVIRSKSHRRARPNKNSRFGGQSILDFLKKGEFEGSYREPSGHYNIGLTWRKEHNNEIMPSFNQISWGLISEAMV